MSVIKAAVLVPYVFELACEKLNHWCYGRYKLLLTKNIQLFCLGSASLFKGINFLRTVVQTILNQIPATA